MTVYGITNCDTVKKARAWLDAAGAAYDFVDFKRTPPTADQVARWVARLGRDTVVNRRGTTWRRLTPAEQDRASSDAGAVTLLVEHPSLIKRPVVEQGRHLLVGFDEAAYRAELSV